jgi:hypothetical protein
LVWALALQRHAAPDPNIGFPICLTEEKFKAAIKGGKIKGVSGSAQAIIERLQPYRNVDWRNTVSDNPLRIVHEFNNTDKHRLLAVVVSAAHIPGQIYFSGNMADTAIAQFAPEQWADLLLRTEPNGTKVLTIRFTKMHHELRVNADFRHQVAFEKFGTREIEPVIPSLVHLRDATIRAIKLFGGEF